MKTLLFSLFVPVVFLFSGSTKPIDKEHCSCENIPLMGNVRIVDTYTSADFLVEITDCNEDVDVQKVNVQPQRCGEWRFVDCNEDFSVKFVDVNPDFTIRFVNCSPGIRFK